MDVAEENRMKALAQRYSVVYRGTVGKDGVVVGESGGGGPSRRERR